MLTFGVFLFLLFFAIWHFDFLAYVCFRVCLHELFVVDVTCSSRAAFTFCTLISCAIFSFPVGSRISPRYEIQCVTLLMLPHFVVSFCSLFVCKRTRLSGSLSVPFQRTLLTLPFVRSLSVHCLRVDLPGHLRRLST